MPTYVKLYKKIINVHFVNPFSISSLLAFLIIFSSTAFANESGARVAIVIDDIGWRKTDVEALSLPTGVTFSVLPHTPFGQVLAHEGQKQGRDILLHVPMEASNGKFMGPGGLNIDMAKAELRASLQASIEHIPYAVGLNNHMGSKFTENSRVMGWTLNFLNERNLFFLDSLTSSKSQGRVLAKEMKMPFLERHIFLDNQLDEAYITAQFELIFRYAKYHQNVVAIAHPHPETIAALNKLIPTLSQQNIELVNVTELLGHSPNWLAMQARKQEQYNMPEKSE